MEAATSRMDRSPAGASKVCLKGEIARRPLTKAAESSDSWIPNQNSIRRSLLIAPARPVIRVYQRSV
jgi:hypothetical protein